MAGSEYEALDMLPRTGRWTPLQARRDKSGKRWNFSYWYTGSSLGHSKAQRLFFWDDRHKDAGFVLLAGERSQPYSSIRNLVDKLVAHPEVRERYRRELRFPLERHYAEFGSFPEETDA